MLEFQTAAEGQLAQLTRDLLLELSQKKRFYTQWKQDWVMWEEYGDAAHLCKETIHVAKDQGVLLKNT